ncbi:hypothetical protein YTPLAS18_27890 [Nitrospira sp.]|nr:hypothetical protein YTPLAS18_27890 [Nitrospira sp.]
MHVMRIALTVAGLLVSMGSAAGPRAEPSTTPGELVRVEDVKVQVTDRGPVVLLMVDSRAIPIFVDMTVAGSIQGALTGEKLPRPMSHDLMHTIMETYGARVTQTVITLKAGTFYGALSVSFKGRETIFDSRSSDSIALAVHFKAPILVPREVVESAGVEPTKPKQHQL